MRFGGFDGGQRMQKNSGNKSCATRIDSENQFVCFDFGGLGEKLEIPCYLEIQRVTTFPDPSSSSRIEKLSSSLSIRAQMDLYQPTLSQKTFWDPIVWTYGGSPMRVPPWRIPHGASPTRLTTI